MNDNVYRVKIKDLSGNQKNLIDTFVCDGECDSCPLAIEPGEGCLFINLEGGSPDFEVPFTIIDGVEQIYVSEKN